MCSERVKKVNYGIAIEKGSRKAYSSRENSFPTYSGHIQAENHCPRKLFISVFSPILQFATFIFCITAKHSMVTSIIDTSALGFQREVESHGDRVHQMGQRHSWQVFVGNGIIGLDHGPDVGPTLLLVPHGLWYSSLTYLIIFRIWSTGKRTVTTPTFWSLYHSVGDYGQEQVNGDDRNVSNITWTDISDEKTAHCIRSRGRG